MASTETFQAEMRAIGKIPGVLYESEGDYQKTRGRHPLQPLADVLGIDTGSLDFDSERLNDSAGLPVTRNRTQDRHRIIEFAPRVSVAITSDSRDLGRLYEAAADSDDVLADAIFELTGVDLESVFDAHIQDGEVRQIDVAASITKFGTDAFASYLPWHAYARSTRTPWGMYVFFDSLIRWADKIICKAPEPKPDPLSIFRLVFYVVYRHELFHYHVERFATRQEVMWHRPIYRPYVDEVEPEVRNTEAWLEEALAQAVVLESRLLFRLTKLDKQTVQRILIPEFDRFPRGYSDYRCEKFGGTQEAHRLLASQILLHQVAPPYKVTDLALPKTEYSASAQDVPGYLLWTPSVYSRFQLTPPSMREFDQYVSRNEHISREKPAKGDHVTYRVRGKRVQINEKKGDLDIASLKAVAKAMGINAFEMARNIRKT